MDKQIILYTHSNEVEQILNGSKKYDFRNKLPKGLAINDVVNVYCTKAKPYLLYDNGKYILVNEKKFRDSRLKCNGKIICQFTVGEIYDRENDFEEELMFANDSPYSKVFFRGHLLDDKYDKELWEVFNGFCSEWSPSINWVKQGYIFQRYAIEITNLKIFDEPRELKKL